MAVEGGGFGVIEDGLVRDADIKNISQDVGGFTGGDGEGYVEGEDKAEDVLGVVDFSDVNEGLERAGVNDICGLE